MGPKGSRMKCWNSTLDGSKSGVRPAFMTAAQPVLQRMMSLPSFNNVLRGAGWLQYRLGAPRLTGRSEKEPHESCVVKRLRPWSLTRMRAYLSTRCLSILCLHTRASPAYAARAIPYRGLHIHTGNPRSLAVCDRGFVCRGFRTGLDWGRTWAEWILGSGRWPYFPGLFALD